MQQRLAWKKTRGVDLQCWHLERGKRLDFGCFTSTRSVKYCLSNAGFGVVEFIGPLGILERNICFSPPDSDFFLVKRKRIQTGTLGPPLFGTRKKQWWHMASLNYRPPQSWTFGLSVGSVFALWWFGGGWSSYSFVPWALPPKMILTKIEICQVTMPFPDSNPRKYWLNLASRNSVTC